MKQIRDTIALLHSMVLSGEKTDGTVIKMVQESIAKIDKMSTNPIEPTVSKIAEEARSFKRAIKLQGYNTIIEWLKDSPNDIEITSVIQLMEDENMLYDKVLKQMWDESF